MIWHSIFLQDEKDRYSPVLPKADCRIATSLGGGNSSTKRVSEDVFAKLRKFFSAGLKPCVEDVMCLAMATYVSDLSIPRKYSRNRWERVIHLHLPVFEKKAIQGLAGEIEHMLSFLTGDKWVLNLRKRTAQPPSQMTLTREFEAVCLLSGGLDSLVGAIDLLEKQKRSVLVGHHGWDKAKSYQQVVWAGLSSQYGDMGKQLLFFVAPPRGRRERERSMRSRSLLFIALAAAVADGIGEEIPLYIPENGLISLNVPLTPTRIGSSSTRTTHPYFIQRLAHILGKLGIKHKLVLPYSFATKGEMLVECANQRLLKKLLASTMSCSHPEQGRFKGYKPGTHCGYCVPCIIRRAAVKKACLTRYDAGYVYNVIKGDSQLMGTRGLDVKAAKSATKRYLSERAQHSAARVIATGGIPAEEIEQYARVFRRGLAEVGEFFSL